MSSEAPQGVTAARCGSDLATCADLSSRFRYLELFRLLSRHNSMMRVLELENHRGETPLFLASVAGNPVCSCCFYIATHADAQAAVDALLQSGVDYTSAYMPDIKVPSHAPAFARIQVSPIRCCPTFRTSHIHAHTSPPSLPIRSVLTADRISSVRRATTRSR